MSIASGKPRIEGSDSVGAFERNHPEGQVAEHACHHHLKRQDRSAQAGYDKSRNRHAGAGHQQHGHGYRAVRLYDPGFQLMHDRVALQSVIEPSERVIRIHLENQFHRSIACAGSGFGRGNAR
jgi:hypothetical protein